MAGKRGRPPKSEQDPFLPTDPDTPRPPTRKERKFLSLYLDTGDVARAAKESGVYKPNPKKEGKENGYRPNAARAGNRILKRLAPQIELLMDQEGMSMLQLVKRLSDGLEASTALSVTTIDESGVPQRDEKGKFVREIIQVPDHRFRQRYLEMGFKLRNAFPAQPAVVKVQGTQGDSVPVSLSVQHQESLKSKSVDELQAMLDEAIQARKHGKLRIVGGNG